MLGRIWRNWITHALFVEEQNSKAILENNLAFLLKLNTELPCNLAIELLDIYLTEMKTVHTKTFMAALFIIGINWENIYSSVGRWLNCRISMS